MSLILAQHSAASTFVGALLLQITEETDCVVGVPAWISWDSIGYPAAGAYPLAGDYSVTTYGPGATTADHWTWTPEASDVGTHTLTIVVRQLGVVIGRVRTRLVVRPALCPTPPADFRVLLCGDSITAADATHVFTNRVFRRLTEAGIPWTSVGEFANVNADSGVHHHGISGRTWKWFEGVDDQGTYQTPFLTASDVTTYVGAHCGGDPPDVVHYQLGPNDSNAYGGAEGGRDAYYEEVADAAETQIARWQAAYPATKISVGTPLGFNSRAFVSILPKQAYAEKRHVHTRHQIERFRRRTASGVYLVATHASLDTTNGFPVGNDIHPEPSTGHFQLGDAIYCALRRHTG